MLRLSILGEPFGVGYFLRLGIEHLNEVATDDFTLLLRVGDAFQILEELVACVYADYVQAETLVCVHHLLELVFAQHSVVNEDARQVGTDGAVEQSCADRRVHTAAQTEYYAVVAKLLFQLLHGSFHE